MTIRGQRCLTWRSYAVPVLCLILASSLHGSGEPYIDYIMRRVSEGLASRESPSVAVRFEGASLVARYTDNLKTEKAPEDFIARTSRSIHEWLQSEQEPWIRHALIEALGEADGEGSPAWMAEYLSDSDPTLRARAAEYLSEPLSDVLERALLEHCARETVWWVKAAFVESLGAGETEESLQLLHGALNDPSRDVRASATQALGQRADPRSVGPLVSAFERGDLIGMDSPAWALGHIGDRKALEVLGTSSTVPFPIVRKAVAWALGVIPDHTSESTLVRLVHDSDAMVRTEAIGSLGKVGGVGAALELLSVLKDEPSERTFYALVRVPEADLVVACEQFLSEKGIDRVKLKARRELCEKAKGQTGGDDVWFWSSGEMHSTFYSAANAKARQVAPVKGRKAVAWEDAMSEDLGGTRRELKRGTQLTIWKAALYKGETWLEVKTGPYGGHLWIRESDTQPIDPKTLRDKPIWTNYGADTRVRGSVKKE